MSKYEVLYYQSSGISVIDTDTHRCLVFVDQHNTIQSSIEHDSIRSGLAYVEGFHLAMMAASFPVRNVLFLGGGGCVGPTQFAAMYPGTTITVVEKDPYIAEIARKYFYYEGLIVIQDAASFVAREPGGWYDVVIVDVYEADGREIEIPGVSRIGKIVMTNKLSGSGLGRVFKVPHKPNQILDLCGGDFELRPYDIFLLPNLAEILNG